MQCTPKPTELRPLRPPILLEPRIAHPRRALTEAALSPHVLHSPAAKTARAIPMPHAQRPSPSTIKARHSNALPPEGRIVMHEQEEALVLPAQAKPNRAALPPSAAHRPPAPCRTRGGALPHGAHSPTAHTA